MASAVPNRERNGALAPGDGKTCTPCSSGQHPEFSAYVLRTTKTSQGRALLQPERNATLMIDVLRSYVAARKFRLRDFVVMPDHLHLLVTVGEGMTVERAMQLVKGGFSYRRLKKECGYLGEVWQRGFSETRVVCQQSFIKHREYRSEEHTSELQSLRHLVCRLLLEKKKLPDSVIKIFQAYTRPRLDELHLSCS